MATIKRFEELQCWQEARKLVRLIYKLTKKREFSKDFALVIQVRKSVISSMANIAEGFHRTSNKEFMKFLDYSRASVAETVSHCYAALDQYYINDEEMTYANRQADKVWKKVNSFITYLSKRPKRYNRTNKAN